MAWEWIGTSAVAVAGIIGTAWNGKKGRDHAAHLAREQRDHQHRAGAYVEVLTQVEQIGQWALLVSPPIDVGLSVPDLPDGVAQAKSLALMRAHGSDEARWLYQDWLDAVREIFKTVQLIRMGQDRASGIPVNELVLKLEQGLRATEQDAREKFAARISAELGGKV